MAVLELASVLGLYVLAGYAREVVTTKWRICYVVPADYITYMPVMKFPAEGLPAKCIFYLIMVFICRFELWGMERV